MTDHAREAAERIHNKDGPWHVTEKVIREAISSATADLNATIYQQQEEIKKLRTQLHQSLSDSDMGLDL